MKWMDKILVACVARLRRQIIKSFTLVPVQSSRQKTVVVHLLEIEREIERQGLAIVDQMQMHHITQKLGSALRWRRDRRRISV